MAPINSIGLLEVSSVAVGYRAADAMLKAASVGLILSRSICSGKYLIAVSGDVSSVNVATAAGGTAAGASVIEQGVITMLHPSVFPAIGQSVQLEKEDVGALGVIETFSAGSIIVAADAAAKAADIILFRLHLAMALGGKGFLLMTGNQASVEAALKAGKDASAGMLVNAVLIPSPDRILLKDYL